MAEEQLDWYAVLGVPKTATTKEITKAYRLKALKVHPDKNPDPNAAKIFHELSQAYDILLDPAARAAFDNLQNVKIQAKARTDKYDATRRKAMDDLKSREEASKKEQQDEKAAALRMKYEMDRIKQEGMKKREAREAELRKQAEDAEEAVAAARQASRDEQAKSLDTTLRIKWKKKKHSFESSELEAIFGKYGPIDSCLSRNQGSAVISFKTLAGAFAAVKAHEKGVSDLEPFSISWAAGGEPAVVANLRLNETKAASPSHSPSSTPAFNAQQIPSFGPPPIFNVGNEVPLVDDYEAATLARMKSKDNERKRLAEEILRIDQEEEEDKEARTKRRVT
ncbi:DnaJ (Hsp40), sub C, member 17 [Podila humilis]|nr:DnaJ (Hsp40), sub C, member 17 [Podila humilis]